jgi:hypothetical protein
LRRDPEQHTQTFDNRRLSVSFRPSAGQKGRKRNACFASRNERLRAAGRKPLISLRALNQAFRGIVCFQGFNRRFISPFSRTRIFGPKSSGQTRPARRRLGASAVHNHKHDLRYLSIFLTILLIYRILATGCAPRTHPRKASRYWFANDRLSRSNAQFLSLLPDSDSNKSRFPVFTAGRNRRIATSI